MPRLPHKAVNLPLTAKVMAGNGIYVRIFEDLRPTPELSLPSGIMER